MKYSFNFVQTSNWLYIVRSKLKKLRSRLDEEDVPVEEAIQLLEIQKKELLDLKEILLRRVSLLGIQKDFLTNLKQIKKEYGIED
jgi:hypothetical protein